MIGRVSAQSFHRQLTEGLNSSLRRVQDLQTQLGSGRRINRLSDDAVGAAAALRLRAQETDWSAYQRSADDATAALGTSDAALQTMSSLLRRVRELATGAVNGALGSEERTAIANEIRDLRNQLHDVGNTRHGGRAIFGGFATSAIAVDGSATPATWSYGGDVGQVLRQLSPTVVLDVNVDGRALFGFDQPAGGDMFSVLGRMEANVRAGDFTALAVDQQDLAARTDSVLVAIGVVGAKMNRVESAAELGRSVMERLTEQRSQIEDVDLAEAILKLNQASAAYQAALGATARADLPSLADFLR